MLWVAWRRAKPKLATSCTLRRSKARRKPARCTISVSGPNLATPVSSFYGPSAQHCWKALLIDCCCCLSCLFCFWSYASLQSDCPDTLWSHITLANPHRASVGS
ncbi:hypothetical protein CAOG_009800 [Capsaspora owczarzaki ATCC 30864]|uniref:Uncharacterized protein n=1 Tax=Capsaspora owczarzaki (strain ATCC 30864) TaxID=595528 RepID=A0A0D2VSR3_CAPO3|nr:hypothetical protein CAOG_009800 [Capsaspora owczarzaki ATCC 30864]